MNKVLLEVKNLSFCYEPKKTILKNINFTVNKGDFVSIVGRNGTGKTTLVKIILRLLKKKNFKRHVRFSTKSISYVPQENLVLDNFPISSYEIIRSGLMAKGLKFFYLSNNKEKIKDIAKNLSMAQLLNKQFASLSGGQKQKVLIARALVTSPELLILDEATANLDKESEKIFFDYIKKHKITIIIISHNINTVSKYVNKVICLNKEAVIHELLNKPGQEEDYKIILHKNCKLSTED